MLMMIVLNKVTAVEDEEEGFLQTEEFYVRHY